MSKMPIFDVHGGQAGEYEIADDLLVLNRGAQAVHDVVVAYRAGMRAGTASTLSKGQVSGSNRKPWQQKGLGRARAGYRQSPVWRGGAVVFGPKPRSYAKSVNKRVASLALARAFSEKIKNGGIRLLTDLTLQDGKTSEIVSIMKAFKLQGRVLLVVDKMDDKIKRAARNMPRVDVCSASDLNVYQLMLFPVLVATKDAMAVLMNRLQKAMT